MKFNLTQQGSLEYIRQMAAEAMRCDDIKSTNELYGAMNTELQNPDVQQKLANLKMLQKYQDLQVKLKFVLFPNLTNQICLELIEKKLLESFDIPEYDLISKIGKKIAFLEIEQDQLLFMNELLKALEKNTQMIGDQKIIISDQEVNPTVKNWLADYVSYPAQSSLRSNFDEINYMNRSKNLSRLGKPEKDKLLQIIILYDSLRARISYYNTTTSAPASEEEIFKDFDLYDLLPGLLNENDDKIPLRPRDEIPGVAVAMSLKKPTPYTVQEHFTLPTVPLSTNKLILDAKIRPATIQPMPPKVPTPSSVRTLEIPHTEEVKNVPDQSLNIKPVNIQDILKSKNAMDNFNQGSGLNFGQNSEQTLDQKRSAKLETDIDKKLEDLKRRINH